MRKMPSLVFACWFAWLCVAAAIGKSAPDRRVKNDFETTGVLLLDAITFPKVVPHPSG